MAQRGGEDRRGIRRADPPPLDPALVQTRDQLNLRLAEELEYAQRVLDLIGGSLAEDRNIAYRFGSQLQQFDTTGQIIGHIAKVLRSASPTRAVERIGMVELRSRLLRGTFN